MHNTHSQKSQISISNKKTNSVKSISDDRDVQENKVSDKTYINEEIDGDTSAIEFQYMKNIEILPMYNLRKPTIKVNKEDIEPIKYDIVTTVKNKLNINNERV